jgi:tRNA pseudouridine32 synthase / 23S rRNA pseudouridine746 synthase
MIPILFETDDMIAIDKPEGVASIPTRTKGEETILSLLSEQVKSKFFIVHRLDREVSGVMLFAKTAPIHKHLNGQFFNRAIKKTYTLLAQGLFAGDSGVIDKPLRQFGSGRMGVDETTGKESITTYEILDRKGEYSLVNAYPQTGRRHQIRVHLYSVGHPIAGDKRYGDKSKQVALPRLMLHASKIVFSLPSGEMKTVVSPLPLSFTSVLSGLGWDEEALRGKLL